MSKNFLRRVLVVDDLESMHQNYREVLTPAKAESANDLDSFDEMFHGGTQKTEIVLPKFELISAFQGKEAVEQVQASKVVKKPFSLCLMDVRMPPGWDGIETTRKMWDIDPDIQVIIISAYANYEYKDIVKVLDVTDNILFIRKPFDNSELLLAATTMSEKWLLIQESRKKMEQMQALVQQRGRDLKTLRDLETNHRKEIAALNDKVVSNIREAEKMMADIMSEKYKEEVLDKTRCPDCQVLEELLETKRKELDELRTIGRNRLAEINKLKDNQSQKDNKIVEVENLLKFKEDEIERISKKQRETALKLSNVSEELRLLKVRFNVK